MLKAVYEAMERGIPVDPPGAEPDENDFVYDIPVPVDSTLCSRCSKRLPSDAVRGARICPRCQRFVKAATSN